MDNHVVPDLQIEAEREFYVVEGLEVLATFVKNTPRQDPAKLDSQVHVFGQRTPVEHLPQPDERFDPVVPLQVDLRVVFGLQRHVSGVHLCERDLRRDGKRGGIHPAELGKMELSQDCSAKLVTVTIRGIQPLIDGREPAAIKLVGIHRNSDDSIW